MFRYFWDTGCFGERFVSCLVWICLEVKMIVFSFGCNTDGPAKNSLGEMVASCCQ